MVKGEMRLVGTRPLLKKYLSLQSVEQARRHDDRPHLTAVLRSLGARNSADCQEKLAMDVWYVDNVSFWLDLRTCPVKRSSPRARWDQCLPST